MALLASETFGSMSEFEAFAEGRNWTDVLAASDEAKEAGMRDAYTLIFTTARWPSAKVNADGTLISAVLPLVKQAQFHAARLAIQGHPLFGGSVEPQVVSEKVGSLQVDYAEIDTRRVHDARLATVRALLLSSGARLSGGPNVQLRKS